MRSLSHRRALDGVWRRLCADRGAAFGLVVIGLLVLAAMTAPLLTTWEHQDYTSFHSNLLDSATGGVPLGRLGGISRAHWLGVEPTTGRDLFARVIYGARVSLLVSVSATAVQVPLGLLFGLLAGLGGRFADAVLGRTIDVVLAFPSLILAIALIGIVPPSIPRPLVLALVIGVFGWGGIARLVRAQAPSLRTRDYVAAARLAGAGRVRIAVREILPGLAGPVITVAALSVPGNVIAEAGLSFLGIGVRPPTPSWGQMLSTATVWFRADPMYIFIPAALIFLTILSTTLVGEGLRTALDPRATQATGKAG